MLAGSRKTEVRSNPFGQFSGNFQLLTSDFKPFVWKFIEANPEDSGAMDPDSYREQSLLRAWFGGFNL